MNKMLLGGLAALMIAGTALPALADAAGTTTSSPSFSAADFFARRHLEQERAQVYRERVASQLNVTKTPPAAGTLSLTHQEIYGD